MTYDNTARDRRRRFPLHAQGQGSILPLPPVCNWWANWLAVAVTGPQHPDWLLATRIILVSLWDQNCRVTKGYGSRSCDWGEPGYYVRVRRATHYLSFTGPWGLTVKHEHARTSSNVVYRWHIPAYWLRDCWGDRHGGVLHGRLVVSRADEIREVLQQRSVVDYEVVTVYGEEVTGKRESKPARVRTIKAY